MSTAASNHQPAMDPFANKRPAARKNPASRRPPHPSNPNQNSSSRKQPKLPASDAPKKAKPHGALDFIDTLDTIGGFHHDGPFDAASSHRNRHLNSKNPSRQAPMAAFDPSALILPPPPPPSAPIPMLATPDHIYPPVIPRRGSAGTLPVSMGYPAGTIAADPKAARLAEAFGIQGKEAWEDFGMEHAVEEDYSSTGGPMGRRSGINREERDAKSASVWDMEETLKSGKPVPAAFKPHSASYDATRGFSGDSERSGTHTAQLKRSKSLMQRIKKGVRSPNLPMELPISPISAEPTEESFEELRSDPCGPSQHNSPPALGRKASLLVKFGLGRRATTSKT